MVENIKPTVNIKKKTDNYLLIVINSAKEWEYNRRTLLSIRLPNPKANGLYNKWDKCLQDCFRVIYYTANDTTNPTTNRSREGRKSDGNVIL